MTTCLPEAVVTPGVRLVKIGRKQFHYGRGKGSGYIPTMRALEFYAGDQVQRLGILRYRESLGLYLEFSSRGSLPGPWIRFSSRDTIASSSSASSFLGGGHSSVILSIPDDVRAQALDLVRSLGDDTPGVVTDLRNLRPDWLVPKAQAEYGYYSVVSHGRGGEMIEQPYALRVVPMQARVYESGAVVTLASAAWLPEFGGWRLKVRWTVRIDFDDGDVCLLRKRDGAKRGYQTYQTAALIDLAAADSPLGNGLFTEKAMRILRAVRDTNILAGCESRTLNLVGGRRSFDE